MESRVVSAIILVSVSITMMAAIPYWLEGVIGQYTRFEVLEVMSAYCEFNGKNADSWKINLPTKNTGTKEASIIGVFINGKPISYYGSENTTDWIVAFVGSVSGSPIDFENRGRITIEPGSTEKIIILITEDSKGAYAFARPGVVIEVSLQSGSGAKYMKMITLS